jgi:hypothetical protein
MSNLHGPGPCYTHAREGPSSGSLLRLEQGEIAAIAFGFHLLSGDEAQGGGFTAMSQSVGLPVTSAVELLPDRDSLSR